jgi:type IV secretory pathway TrbD component
MKTEPTLLIEAVRLLAILAGTFGVAVNAEEQAAIVAGLGGLIGLVSVGLAIYNRLKVFSPKTVDQIATDAYVAGVVGAPNPPVGDPPKGT